MFAFDNFSVEGVAVWVGLRGVFVSLGVEIPWLPKAPVSADCRNVEQQRTVV